MTVNTSASSIERGLDGYLRRQNWRKRVWLPALRRANPCPVCEATGVDNERCQSCEGTGTKAYFRPYDLRHTAATLLIYAGRTINEVAEHLGPRRSGLHRPHVHAHLSRSTGVPWRFARRRHSPGARTRCDGRTNSCGLTKRSLSLGSTAVSASIEWHFASTATSVVAGVRRGSGFFPIRAAASRFVTRAANDCFPTCQ